jgi:hypothetical protein
MRTSSPPTLLALASLAVLAGCTGVPDGAQRSSSRNTKTGAKSDTSSGSTAASCTEVDKPVTIRSTSDFDRLPTGCWDLYATLRIEGAAVTSVAKLGQLRSVNDLEVVDTGLQSFDWSRAVEVWGALVVTGNSKLTSLDKLAVYDAEDLETAFTIRNNAALASLGGASYVKSLDGELRITDNPKLGAVALDELVEARSVVVSSTGITRLSLGSLSSVGRVEISGNQQLTSLLGTAGTRLGGDLILRGNRALPGLGSWSPARIEGSLTIDDNDALTSLAGLSRLRSVTGAVAITGNAVVADIDAVSHLQSIGAAVEVTGNASLDNCRVLEIDHCVPSGVVTAYSNKPNTGGSCGRCWCE